VLGHIIDEQTADWRATQPGAEQLAISRAQALAIGAQQ
jgi:hypothetical protein